MDQDGLDINTLSRRFSSAFSIKVMTACILLVMVAAIILTYLSPKVYTATAKVQLVEIANTALPAGLNSNSESAIATYVEIVNDPSFLGVVRNRLTAMPNAVSDVQDLYESGFRVEAQTLEDTQIMKISVEASKPKNAQILADTAANSIVAITSEIQGGSSTAVVAELNKRVAAIDRKLKDMRTSYAAYNAEHPVSSSMYETDAELGHRRDRIEAEEENRKNLTDQLSLLSVKDAYRDHGMQIICKALVPKDPSGPSWPRNLGVGFLVGIAFGIVTISVYDAISRLRKH